MNEGDNNSRTAKDVTLAALTPAAGNATAEETLPPRRDQDAKENQGIDGGALLPLEKEAEVLLSQLPDLKPGVQTTEFWLIAAVSMTILALSACGKVDATVASIVVSGLAGWYQRQRLNAKATGNASRDDQFADSRAVAWRDGKLTASPTASAAATVADSLRDGKRGTTNPAAPEVSSAGLQPSTASQTQN